MLRGLLLCAAACLPLLVACEASPTNRPPLLGGVPIPPPGTPPVAHRPLNEHLPRIVSHAENGELVQMSLWAMGADGLRERVFDARTKMWGPWIQHGIPDDALYPPVDWDDLGLHLQVDAGLAGDRDQALAVFGFNTAGLSAQRLLALATDRRPFGASNIELDDWDHRQWMRAVTAVSQPDPQRVRVFGTWQDDGPNRPEERLVRTTIAIDAGGSARSLQNEPAAMPVLMGPIDGVDKEMLVEPGANSAVRVPRVRNGNPESQTFVFVKREPDGMDGHEGLAVWLENDQGQEAWLDLGTPVAPPSEIVGEPLAFAWRNATTGLYTVNVMVVARRDEGNTRYEVYERFWHDDGSSPAVEGWRPWSNHGSPRWDPYDASKGQLLEPGTRFRLTGAVVWELDGVTRVNVIGYANPETDRDGVSQPHRLVEYVWDGAVWTWGFHHEPPPSGLGVRAHSAAWTDTGGTIRISIAGRDTDGGIYERFYLIDQSTGWSGWFWNDLTR